jgi:hypothetical protein
MDPATQFPASFRLSVAAQAAQNAWDQILTRTTTDQPFRAQLLADPVATLRGAGIAVPDGIVVTPLEFDPAHAYLPSACYTGCCTGTTWSQRCRSARRGVRRQWPSCARFQCHGRNLPARSTSQATSGLVAVKIPASTRSLEVVGDGRLGQAERPSQVADAGFAAVVRGWILTNIYLSRIL